MSTTWVTKEHSLRNYFILAFLFPIVGTLLVTLIDGLQTGLVTTNQVSPLALVVIFSMVHAPTVAAMIVAYRDEGFLGIRKLFRQLKHWKYDLNWYLKALLIFPLSILGALLVLSLFSPSFTPVFSFSIFTGAVFLSSLWEEIGWTGYALPRMLQRSSALKTGILLGVVHTFWHLAADYWGSIAFYGEFYLYALHFSLWLVGLVVLRVLIVWIYLRTASLVLGWLIHFSYTGGQLLMTVTLSAVNTLIWNTVFVLILLCVMAFLAVRNRDFRAAWQSGTHAASGA